MPSAVVVAVLALGVPPLAPGLVVADAAPSAVTVAPAVASRPVVVRGCTWYLRDTLSSGPATSTFIYGRAGDFPMMGDWDGDGLTTPGVVRGSLWLLRNSRSAGPADISFAYGRSGDMPVVGDWDGGGTDTPGVVRGGTWFLRNSLTAGVATVSFLYGSASQQVVAGDWDGDGRSTPGVVSGGSWYLRNSLTAGEADLTLSYGRPTDHHVVGDWDGDGDETIGVVRANTWYLSNTLSPPAGTVVLAYGSSTDLQQSSTAALSILRGARPLPAAWTGVDVRRLPTTSAVVALTFDAGGDAAGLPAILATLQASGVPATFFLKGTFAQDFPAQARMIGLRYPVGNHTMTHPHLPLLSDDAVRAEVTDAYTAILAQTRFDQHPLFRFPFGDVDTRTRAIVNSMGYASIWWTVDTLGWAGTSGGQSVDTVVSRVLAGLTPGEIVLMHVGANPDDHTTLDADALPRVIAELKARGYGFTTILGDW